MVYSFHIVSYENNRLNAIIDIIKSHHHMYYMYVKCVPVQKARICIYTLVIGCLLLH